MGLTDEELAEAVAKICICPPTRYYEMILTRAIEQIVMGREMQAYSVEEFAYRLVKIFEQRDTDRLKH